MALAGLFGLLTAVAFSLWSLGRVCEVKAAQLFRSAIAPLGGRPRLPYLIALAVSIALLAALAILTATDPWLATSFIIGSVGAVALFLGASWLIMAGARRTGRPRDPELRMALANLHRPGAPTPGVVAGARPGAHRAGDHLPDPGEPVPSGGRAHPGGRAGLFLHRHPAAPGRPVHGDPARHRRVGEIQTTPMVRGRITHIKGVPADEAPVQPDASWVLRGDRGLTYSATPPENSEVVEGTWWPADYAGPPLVSFDANIADGLGVGIGDTMTLNILGRPMTVEIGNLRKIDWGSLGMNFTFVFAPGTLEAAPHSVIATVHVDDPALEAEVQRAVTDALPNVTAIRVKDALEGANRILSAVSIAVRATAAVTLIAGTLVLAGAIAAGHARRVRDAVILKVLGATRWRIVKTYLLEYGLLGLSTAAIASLVGSVASAVVVVEVMRGDFVLPPGVLALTALLATGITVSFGFVGTWRALGQRPAPMLRNE
ncbi:MAG: ABC transporter permease [Thalassobaculum sp.]